jgi:hypothetical protein
MSPNSLLRAGWAVLAVGTLATLPFLTSQHPARAPQESRPPAMSGPNCSRGQTLNDKSACTAPPYIELRPLTADESQAEACMIMENPDGSRTLVNPDQTWADCFAALVRNMPVDHPDEFYRENPPRDKVGEGYGDGERNAHRHWLQRI